MTDTRNIKLVGGELDGRLISMPKKLTGVTYAQDEDGTILYADSGNIDEMGFEIWVPLEATPEPKEGA